MNEKTLKLLMVLSGVFLATSILLLAVDYQLKNTIIEEAENLRRAIRYGQRNEGQGSLRNRRDDDWYSTLLGDMVAGRDAGMEEAGDTSPHKAPSADKGQPDSAAKDGNS